MSRKKTIEHYPNLGYKYGAVRISSLAQKQLRWMPENIRKKVAAWMYAVELLGLREARKRPGFHDEPLAGKRAEQRSIRLNRAYRVIYEVITEVPLAIEILEVTKHEY